jgi:hypothetical protein
VMWRLRLFLTCRRCTRSRSIGVSILVLLGEVLVAQGSQRRSIRHMPSTPRVTLLSSRPLSLFGFRCFRRLTQQSRHRIGSIIVRRFDKRCRPMTLLAVNW